MNLQPGDGFATKGRGIIGWASRELFIPKTDRLHYGILWRKLKDGDWLILESIMKGLAIGKLSWYAGRDTKFYRVNCPAGLRYAAPETLIDWGRSLYDYFLIPKIFFGALFAWVKILFTEGRLRKLKAEDLPYGKNSALLCTEGFEIAYLGVGVAIVNPEILPLPSAFKKAERLGRIRELL